MRRFTIANNTLTQDSKPYVIAEIGTNHGGDPSTCLKMVQKAAECGVGAIKLQKRTNKKLFTKEFYNSPYNSENALAPTYGEHRERLELPKGCWRDVRALCDDLKVAFIATAFDPWALDFIMDIEVDAVKIASGDNKNTPLQKLAADTSLPCLISLGGTTSEDVDRIYTEWPNRMEYLSLLHCVAEYPCPSDHLNLARIDTLVGDYTNVLIGYSSHFNGIVDSAAAYMHGAIIHERHFTINRAARGTDHSWSLEPSGLKKVVRDLGRLVQMGGDEVLAPTPDEQKPLFKMGKKIVAARPLSSGIVVEEKDLAFKSPNDGMPPYRWIEAVGRYLSNPLDEDENIEKGWEE